jgi:hypothetical protein
MNKDTSVNNKKAVKTNSSLSSDQALIFIYKYFWIIIVLASLAVLYFGYQMFLLPRYKAIASNEEITNKQQQYIDKLQYYNQLIELKNTYEKINPEDKEKINQIVSTVNDQNEIYREAEFIIKKNGLTVESIEPVALDKVYDLPNISGATKKSLLLNNMKLTMTSCKLANVDYDSLIRVLKTFELNLRIMDVTKIEFDPAQKKAALNFITYQF